MRAPLRVVVAEDSPTVRAVLVAALSADPGFVVVGEASSGEGAVALVERLRPDVVSLDMMLDGMSGLEATVEVMSRRPTPILVVSASVNRGELFRTYDALAAGAVDVLEKPLAEEDPDRWADGYRARLRLVSRIRVIRHPRGALGRLFGGEPAPARAAELAAVAIGASTGGPAAVVALLRALPAPSPVPLLLLVHLGGPFGAAFAEWLDGTSPHRVGFARDGERLGERPVVLAPPDRHLVVRRGRLALTEEPEVHSCRPAVDVLFRSCARELGNRVGGVLLTGMGRDGAAGLKAIRDAGGPTIAQDEASSVVWGMPREAVQLGAAAEVLPIGEIGPAIARWTARSGPGSPP